jgi:hypothetical protein
MGRRPKSIRRLNGQTYRCLLQLLVILSRADNLALSAVGLGGLGPHSNRGSRQEVGLHGLHAGVVTGAADDQMSTQPERARCKRINRSRSARHKA